jgi:hypothetical protein
MFNEQKRYESNIQNDGRPSAEQEQWLAR